jgi:hypothetical protein
LDRGLRSDFSHPQRIRYTVYKNNNQQLISYDEIPEENIIFQEESTIKLRQNTTCENLPYISTPSQITSEVVLGHDARFQLCSYLYGVRLILGPSNYRVVIDKINKDFMSQDHEDNVQGEITLSYPFYRTIKSVDISDAVVRHESMHVLYNMLDENDPIINSLKNAHDQIIKNMKYRMPSYIETYDGYKITDYEKIWAVITESTYEDQYLDFKDSRAGHPWDNPTEMSSSITSVLGSYPNQFLNKYNELKNNEKYAIRQAIIATIKLIKTQPDELLRTLIPNYDYLFKELDISAKDLE